MKLRFGILAVLLLSLMCALVGCAVVKPDDDNSSISQRLAAPTITIKDNTVFWEQVPNADYYVIFVDDKWVAVEHTNSFVLNYTTNGIYAVKVYAADSYQRYKSSSFSNQVNYVVQRKPLQSPEILLTCETLQWHDVEGASKYEVYVNGSRSSVFDIHNNANVNSVQLGFAKSGVYDIFIKAVSFDSAYEGESTSNHVTYRFSNNKKWSAGQIANDWQTFGNVQYRSNRIFMQYDSAYDSGISNRVFVDYNHSVLYLICENLPGIVTEFSSSNFCVKVNDSVVTPILQAHENIPNNCFVYDLKDFVNQMVDVQITIVNNAVMYLNEVKLFTIDNVSQTKIWNSLTIPDEWLCSGRTVEHAEGFCLETGNGNSSSIANEIHISSESVLKITFFKFDRVGAVDTDPKVYVYVNGELLPPTDSATDYATVTSQKGGTFSYDLSKYQNSNVQVEIRCTEGEHACFSLIQLGN